MERIKSITQAYSMQPNTLYVMTKEAAEKYFDQPNACAEIKVQTIMVGGSPLDYYVGYNFEGKKIFQYLIDSVNVHFE